MKKNKPIIPVQSSSDRTIDVSSYIQNRGFELSAMEKAVKDSFTSGRKRVFQTVSRHMRRRAASYNVKRLPVKMRKSAVDQISRDPEPPSRPRKSRKSKRQSSKVLKSDGVAKGWMESHLWHAKRMKMVRVWNRVVALHSNSKNQRSLYRASKVSCTAIDVSYLLVLQLHGPKDIIVEKMASVMDPFYPSLKSALVANGSKEGSGYLHSPNAYPHEGICPFSFLWNASNESLWLWIHSDIFDSAQEMLSNLFDESGVELSVIPMNRFEFRGPRSHALLAHGLHLAQPNEFWGSIKDLTNPASLPSNTVIGLTIHDPRLTPFPHIPPRHDLSDEVISGLNQLSLSIPDHLAQSMIWDQTHLQSLIENQISEGSICKRREALLIPGSTLLPTPEDGQIPILLISKSSDSKISRVCGWDLIVPSGWGLPLWRYLAKGGVQHGGIRDRRKYQLENGFPTFPHDYPESLTYCRDLCKDANESLAKYLRTPPGKRPHYSVPCPFWTDFNGLSNSNGDVEMDKEWSVPALNPITVLHSPLLTRYLDRFISSLDPTTSFADACKGLESQVAHIFPKSNWISDVFVRVRVVSPKGSLAPFSVLHHSTMDPIFKQKSVFEGLIPSLETRVPIQVQGDPIGYLTSGGYSLSIGKSVGFGCMTLGSYLTLLNHGKDKWVAIVPPSSQPCLASVSLC